MGTRPHRLCATRSYPHSNSNPNPDSSTRRRGRRRWSGYPNADADSHCYADANPNADSHCYADPDADPNPNPYAGATVQLASHGGHHWCRGAGSDNSLPHNEVEEGLAPGSVGHKG